MKEKIYFIISITTLALSSLGIEGYVALNKKFIELDKKFTAVSDSLKDYKATVQNQGLYSKLKKQTDSTEQRLNQLNTYVEGFFGGSELFNEETAKRIGELEERINSLEKRKSKTSTF